MIDASSYSHLGEVLHDALVMYKSEIALIEVKRKREARRLTYLDLRHEAMRLANTLSSWGVAPGSRVAVCMSNQSRWLVAATAAFHCGAVVVPIDHKLTGAEQSALLLHCKPMVLFTEFGLCRRMGPADIPHTVLTDSPEARTPEARTPVKSGLPASVHRFDDALSDDTTPPPLAPRAASDIATIVYSSGTGGTPKGCMLSHGAYLAQWDALFERFPLQPGDRWFSILPTNHAIDFMCGFLGALGCGATVVHQRTLRPELLVDTMQRYRITHMAVVPMLLEAFERALQDKLDSCPDWQRTALDLLGEVNGRLTQTGPKHALSRWLLKPVHDGFGGHLKMLFCGGAFTDRARADRFYKLGLPVVIGYGLTEACTVVTVGDNRPYRGDTVGRPVKGMEITVYDPDADGIGEVWVKGPTLMTGYLDEPGLTAEAFTDGWLKTGDRGRIDASGHLKLLGRSKNMIVTDGGKNIYPEDIEQAFEGVCDELAVFAENYLWPRDALGTERLVAVVKPKSELSALIAVLRDRNRRLPAFKRISGVVAFEGEYPRTASMKLKRAALADNIRSTNAEVRPL